MNFLITEELCEIIQLYINIGHWNVFKQDPFIPSANKTRRSTKQAKQTYKIIYHTPCVPLL